MTYFCALPAILWDMHARENEYGFSIAAPVQHALAIEQKLVQGTCTEDEQLYYKQCCEKIEAVATPYLLTPFATIDQFRLTLELHQLPVSVSGAEYVHITDILLASAPAYLRLGATFFPPNTLARHIVGFQQLAREHDIIHHAVVRRRCHFFTLACEFACGVIEVQNPLTIAPSHVGLDAQV